MPQFRVTITTELLINVADHTAAHAYADAVHYPHATHLKPPVIDIKEQRPEDNRLLTQVPNIPKDRLTALVTAMSDVERIIIVMARTPCEPHDIYTAIRLKYPTIDLFVIAKAIANLKSEGWLNVMKYHVERQLFRDIDAPALATVHNETIRKYAR